MQDSSGPEEGRSITRADSLPADTHERSRDAQRILVMLGLRSLVYGYLAVLLGVDRMAYAWFILKYIDHEAEFLFVPAGQSPQPEGAEPIDIPGVRLSHHGGHCTFHTMLREYHLIDPVLQRIVRVVDEADTVQDVLLENAAPGLDLICQGMRLISPDDQARWKEEGSSIMLCMHSSQVSPSRPRQASPREKKRMTIKYSTFQPGPTWKARPGG